jgi:hypothetical protein
LRKETKHSFNIEEENPTTLLIRPLSVNVARLAEQYLLFMLLSFAGSSPNQEIAKLS